MATYLPAGSPLSPLITVLLREVTDGLPTPWFWLSNVAVNGVAFDSVLVTEQGLLVIQFVNEDAPLIKSGLASIEDELRQKVAALKAYLIAQATTIFAEPRLAPSLIVQPAFLVAQATVKVPSGLKLSLPLVTLDAPADSLKGIVITIGGQPTLTLDVKEIATIAHLLSGMPADDFVHVSEKEKGAPAVSGGGLARWFQALAKLPKRIETILGRVVEVQSNSGMVRVVALEQALEQQVENGRQSVGIETFVPNSYILYLAEVDFAHHTALQGELVTHLRDVYLGRLIQARGYRTVGQLSLTLEKDATLAKRECRATSQIETEVSVSGQNGYLEIQPSGRRIVISKTRFTLGRHANCNFNLTDLDSQRVTSRNHAHIVTEEGGMTLYDGFEGEPSRAGTFVNGKKVSATRGHRLKRGDRIILGPTQRLYPKEPLPGSLVLIYFLP